MAIRMPLSTPGPTPGPEVDTPQALKDWADDVAIGLMLDDCRRPAPGDL